MESLVSPFPSFPPVFSPSFSTLFSPTLGAFPSYSHPHPPLPPTSFSSSFPFPYQLPFAQPERLVCSAGVGRLRNRKSSMPHLHQPGRLFFAVLRLLRPIFTSTTAALPLLWDERLREEEGLATTGGGSCCRFSTCCCWCEGGCKNVRDDDDAR